MVVLSSDLIYKGRGRKGGRDGGREGRRNKGKEGGRERERESTTCGNSNYTGVSSDMV